MNSARMFSAILCAALLESSLCLAADPPTKIDFAHDVLPVLKARCASCHTNGTYKGSFSLDTRIAVLKSKAVVPGKSAESELIKRITSQDLEVRMPPKGESLTAKEQAILKKWIDEGLNWEPGFSFLASAYVPPLKPRKPVLPPAKEGNEHPVDRILGHYYATHKVQAPPKLDDVAFLRRVYWDLIGMLPAPAEVEAFLKDSTPDKRTKLVSRLLNENRAFADHWLTFWNDLLRNDYVGTGFIDGGRKQISGWLYRSLAENKPFDQFVRELISPTPESEGFIKGIKWRGAVNASQVTELQFAQNIGQVFFGVNLKCASCHDSFIDSWKLDDAYSLAAVIADKPLMTHRCDKPTGKLAGPRFIFPELGKIDATLSPTKRLEQLAALITHPENGRLSRTIVNRIWHRLMGRGIVHPVDMMGNKPWSEDLLDYLATYLSENGYDFKKLLEHITTSRVYQSQAVVIAEEITGDAYVFRGVELKRLSAEQFIDGVWQVTRSGPVKATAPVSQVPTAVTTPPERQFVRVALVNADPLMRSLGRPNREQVVTTRPDQLSTLQALDLSNGQILTDTLNRGGANILKANPQASPERLIEVVYLQILSRRPNTEEAAIAREIVGSKPTSEDLADLLWALFMLPEFQLIR